MPIPDYQSLMLPVLLTSSNGEVRFAEVVGQLADQLGLSPEERSELLPSGKQTVFNNRVHWAKTYMAQAGLIENTRRGYFTITLRGKQALASQPAHIDNTFLSQFEEFKQFKERAKVSQPKSSKPEAGEEETSLHNETETPEEIMRRAQKQL